jgi:hypothetical protein
MTLGLSRAYTHYESRAEAHATCQGWGMVWGSEADVMDRHAQGLCTAISMTLRNRMDAMGNINMYSELDYYIIHKYSVIKGGRVQRVRGGAGSGSRKVTLDSCVHIWHECGRSTSLATHSQLPSHAHSVLIDKVLRLHNPCNQCSLR